MNKYIRLIVGVGIIGGMFACNEAPDDMTGPVEDRMSLAGISLGLHGLDPTKATRAESDYAVNTGADPTYTLTGRETWELDVTIYKGDTPYVDGDAVFEKVPDTYQGENRWEPTSGSEIYFPNYTRQQVALNMHPVGWQEIAPDQSTSGALFGQDVLEQNGDNTIIVFPAHIPAVELRHAHSMLNFRLLNVNQTELESVTIIIDDETYTPYQVETGVNPEYNPEYMLIVPVGTSDPVIAVSTIGGARYLQTTVEGIDDTKANTCYCFTLDGLELKLGEITIAEWTTGEGILGEYTLERSYPSFRGPANAIATLYFDNGLEQSILFNDQGETNVRPAGRRIIRVWTDHSNEEVDIVLDGMVIDLTTFFEDYYQNI